jgi:hypothetical protein
MSADVFVISLLVVTSAVYMWVGRNFIGRESWQLPQIFWNPVARSIAAGFPFVGFVVVITAGFMITNHGWWYFIASTAAFFLLAVRPKYFG